MATRERSAEDFEKDFVEMKERCQVSYTSIHIYMMYTLINVSDKIL